MRPRRLALAGALLALAPAAARPEPRVYAPHARENWPANLYWGDTHLHTSNSADANLMGTLRLGPAEAFRFARGLPVESDGGLTAKLARPLDFLVVCDHAEYLGLLRLLRAGDPALLEQPAAKRWAAMIAAGGEQARTAFLEVARSMSAGPSGVQQLHAPEGADSPWKASARAADDANAPGSFTAFIGFEWTSQPDGDNLHRVVVLRDGAAKAARVLPFSAFDSQDPEALWQWIERYEGETGGRAIAIPHNSNVSGGRMFEERRFGGEPMTREYARRRARFEPVVEATQIKGDSETHPALSPNDEFADFGRWDRVNLGMSRPHERWMFPYEYVRSALALGLRQDAKLGANPFRFGLVAGTDAHTGLATADDDDFWGKFAKDEPSAGRAAGAFVANPTAPRIAAWETLASGYTAVWATHNTREAIFDAFERRETYATTGPRMRVRFFGGWGYAEVDAARPHPERAGYAKGVPMGAPLPARPSGARAPSFLVSALRDPDGANLDRVQIVKGWLGRDGETLEERVYDVAWSGGRRPGRDGRLPPVGSTVDLAHASYTHAIGAASLAAVWSDPNFDPGARAFYYVRVLEIPTPRWPVYDAVRFGTKPPEGAVLVQQERAYTSAIWYAP